MKSSLLLLLIIFSFLLSFSSAEQCGHQAGGALCPNNLCCSAFGWCGDTEAYCKRPGCQSQCTPDGHPPPFPPSSPPPPPPSPPSPGPPPPPEPTGRLTDIITRSQFDEMLKHRNDPACPARGFYTYEAFIAASNRILGFADYGDTAARKRQLAAFFAQSAYGFTGGCPTTTNGPCSRGYCCTEEVNPPSDYCSPSEKWPCVPGKRYYGRGLTLLTGNDNYGMYGLAISEDLLNNPDLVSHDAVVAFKVLIQFWMKPVPPKPSGNSVLTGRWQPTYAEREAGILPGYGVITNIVNGGKECGHGYDARVADRIELYRRNCDIFGVDPGVNLDCYNQRPYDSVHFSLDAAI